MVPMGWKYSDFSSLMLILTKSGLGKKHLGEKTSWDSFLKRYPPWNPFSKLAPEKWWNRKDPIWLPFEAKDLFSVAFAVSFWGCLENLVYHFFRQLWLVLGVKLMKLTATCFPGVFWGIHIRSSIHSCGECQLRPSSSVNIEERQSHSGFLPCWRLPIAVDFSGCKVIQFLYMDTPHIPPNGKLGKSSTQKCQTVGIGDMWSFPGGHIFVMNHGNLRGPPQCHPPKK